MQYLEQIQRQFLFVIILQLQLNWPDLVRFLSDDQSNIFLLRAL